MKICVINNLYEPYHRGGTETFVKKQITSFLGHGVDVVLITTRPFLSREKKKIIEKKSSLRIIRFFPLNIFSFYHLGKFPFWIRIVWRFFDIFNIHSLAVIYLTLKKEKPDFVYNHNLTGISYLVPRLIKKMNIKNIQTLHDVSLIKPSGLLLVGKEKMSFGEVLYAKLTKCLFASPDEVNFPSSWLHNFYNQYNFFPHSAKKIIPNYQIKKENLIVGKQLKKPGQTSLLYLGQIEKHKGILFLIEVLNNLAHLKYQLIVVGSGAQLKQAHSLAANNHKVSFLGWQTPDQISSLFHKIDYTIVPSLCYENSPTVIFESLKATVPVIACNLGGIPEILENGINGFLFTAGDKNDLTNVLKNVIIKK